MAFKKITSSELSSRGATTLPDQPTISAAALKEEFDAPAKEIVAPKFNTLIDDLESSTAASNIGVTAPAGSTSTTIQQYLDELSSSKDTFKTIKVGTTDIVASGGDDTLELRAGSNVTLTPDATNKVVVINSAGGGGQSTGDMLASDYDSNYAVKSAGGIASYVASQAYTLPAATSNSLGGVMVGNTLQISGGVLDVANSGTSVSVSYTGTASATGIRKQIITVDNIAYTVDGSQYMEQTKNLSTTQDTAFTFTNSDIHATSEVDVYASIYGLAPKDVSVDDGECVVTFNKYSAAQALLVRIRIK